MSWRTFEPNEEDGEIRRRLLSPVRQVTLEELAAIWCGHTIVFRLRGLGQLATNPSIPGKIRGAFGHALMAGASQAALADRPCTFDPPSAFEVLFRKQGALTRGDELPSPWIVEIDRVRSDLQVSLRLFGFAIEWAAAAAEAMSRALRDLVEWPEVPNLNGLECAGIAGRTARTAVGLKVTKVRDFIEIELLSPLTLTGIDPRDQPHRIVPSIGRRLSGLARWHDVALDELVDWRAIKQGSLDLEYRFADVESADWKRRSSRQSKNFRMRGVQGRIAISGKMTHELAILFELGSTCAIGADVALGCGRYRIL